MLIEIYRNSEIIYFREVEDDYKIKIKKGIENFIKESNDFYADFNYTIYIDRIPSRFMHQQMIKGASQEEAVRGFMLDKNLAPKIQTVNFILRELEKSGILKVKYDWLMNYDIGEIFEKYCGVSLGSKRGAFNILGLN